ncbi:Uncharacterised protein [Bordetella ansorpii]|uniref:Uncharacterized protein n=1 Tax=Bordetella ansorpii TaxID=288768 RepID=A0A157PC86_9BORD|nr:hypothetical protein [Bordetella ansorpii]SAI31098.1 Uncharacterised protein [Bordetella ansorpii]
MRFFDLFLRRAGVERTEAGGRRRGTSRLTVVCPRDSLDSLRKQICLDFSAAGLSVSQFQVDAATAQAGMAQACITVDCPPELRAELMSQAKRLSANPAVRHVHFGASAAASTTMAAAA